MDFSSLVAKKVQELMQQKDISTYKLEELSGVYSSTITAFLTRKNQTIRLENLYYICQGLGITLSEFFADKRFIEVEPTEWLKRKK